MTAGFRFPMEIRDVDIAFCSNQPIGRSDRVAHPVHRVQRASRLVLNVGHARTVEAVRSRRG
jgi:hypothetical protein